MGKRVVVADDPKIDAETFRRVLGDTAEVTVATLDSEADLREHGAGADALVTHNESPVTEAVLDDLPGLSVLAQSSIGVDNVDVAAAAERDVVVLRSPDYCLDEVATHAVTLLLACVRNLRTYDQAVRDGEWDWHVGAPLHRFAGSTVGLVSFGPIARTVAERLRGFDCDVLAYDPYVDAGEMAEHRVEKVTFAELTERADHLSVHAPLTDETEGLVDADAFARLRDDAVVVNTGRGGVVDEDDLLDALEAGELGAAGLDVFEQEPPRDSPLREREDVYLSPHVGWYSEEAMADSNEGVAADLARVFDGEEPKGRVDPDAPWA